MNLICRLRGHDWRDTGNRFGQHPVKRCLRCKVVWAGPDELFTEPR